MPSWEPAVWYDCSTANTMMPIIMAEYWKRIGVNLQDPRTWLKKVDYTTSTMTETARLAALNSSDIAVTAQDTAVLLYGQATGSKFGGLLLGGSDNNGFTDALGGKANLDNKFSGNWRFFGKTGTGEGTRSGRSRNEQIIGGFFCVPASQANTVLKQGRAFAFFINIQAAGPTEAIRQSTLKAVAAAMVPEISGAKNLWSK